MYRIYQNLDLHLLAKAPAAACFAFAKGIEFIESLGFLVKQEQGTCCFGSDCSEANNDWERARWEALPWTGVRKNV